MPEDPNGLLQRLVETQQELLAIARQEAEQTARFREQVLQDQKLAVRRGVSFSMILLIGIFAIALLLAMIADAVRSKQPPSADQRTPEEKMFGFKVNRDKLDRDTGDP
jgi:hypothetical protein